MNTLESILAEQTFFNGLEPRYLQLIAGCASNARFAADHYIFHEGEEATQFYLIRHGRVALETFAPGRGVVPIETLPAGEVLGWSWLFPPVSLAFQRQSAGSNAGYRAGWRLPAQQMRGGPRSGL